MAANQLIGSPIGPNWPEVEGKAQQRADRPGRCPRMQGLWSGIRCQGVGVGTGVGNAGRKRLLAGNMSGEGQVQVMTGSGKVRAIGR